MQIEMNKETVCVPKTVCELSAVQNIDLEINLPDYCSDIKRILKCFVIPNISSVQATGDRVTAKGDTVVRLVYIGENDCIDCYEESVDLSAFSDVKNMPESPVVTAKAQTSFVNCRAASQRRAVIGSSVGINFTVYCCEEIPICCDANEESLETKKGAVKAVCQSVIGEKTFDVSETVSLDSGKKPIGKIIGYDSSTKIESAKSVSGKLLIKGEIEISICYLADTKDFSTERLVHTMPISQIIEVAQIDDSFETEILLDVSALAVSVKSDSSGSNTLLEIASKISAFVHGIKQSNVNFITDCYCTEYESKSEYKSFDFLCSIGNLSKTQKVTVTPELAQGGVKNVLDIFEIASSCCVSHSGGTVSGKGSVTFGILFQSKNEEIQYVERNADFDFGCEIKEPCSKTSCKPSLDIINLTAAVNSGSITVSFEAVITGKVYSVITKQVLESVTADEQQLKGSSKAEITVYYCSKGESLWDIAKKYNIGEKYIKEENSIDEEVISQDRMLIIPCA